MERRNEDYSSNAVCIKKGMKQLNSFNSFSPSLLLPLSLITKGQWSYTAKTEDNSLAFFCSADQ
jgi:hypothetical protein